MTRLPAKKVPTNRLVAARRPKPAALVRAVSRPAAPLLLKKSACACGGGCPRCQDKPPVQAKLAVSEPGDIYEREADRLADEVMRMPAPFTQQQPLSLSAYPLAPSVPPPGPGRPLDAAARAFFEPRFGHDLSKVRLHTDEKAAESARRVDALAYTAGSNVVFGAGRYEPGSPAGQRLLAHELAHVVQQGRGAGFAGLVQRQGAGLGPARSGSFPSCEGAPPEPDGRPPPLDRWLENDTLKRIRSEAPGENFTLLSRSRGSRGEAVRLVQQALLSFGCDERDENLLPVFGADGIFGGETDRAVKAFQEGRTNRDGIVGPLTLAALDEVMIPPAETRRGPPDAGGGGTAAAPPSKSIRTHGLKARIQSVSMTLPKDIRVVRLAAKNDKAHQTLDRPFEFAATIQLNPGPDLAGVRFGFFQLGRPFELWRVTYRRVSAKADEGGADRNRDETFPLRSKLPALDHVSTFYPFPDGKQPAPVSASSVEAKAEFRDRPGNLFDDFLDVGGELFQLSGIFTQSFFFTALGLVTAGGQALLLKTFYWTVRNCEEIGPNLFKTVKGPPVAISGPFDCLQGNCRENEPGADKFGSSGAKSFGAIVEETLPTYGDGKANKPPAGPGDFKLPCAK